MMATNGETLFLTLGHPGRVPAVLLGRPRAAHRDRPPGRLPGAGDPGAGGHVDGDDRPRHRHRVRARLRGAQASGATPLGRPRLLAAKIMAVIGGRAAPGRGAGGGRLRPRLDPGGDGRRRCPGRRGRRRPWCSAPWPSAASGCCWPERSSRWSTWPWSTASSWCCCCSAGMLIPLGKLPGWLAGVSEVLPASALADALHAALGSGTARLGCATGWCCRSGRWPPRWWPGHLPLGVSRRTAAAGGGSSPVRSACVPSVGAASLRARSGQRADDVADDLAGAVDEEGLGSPLNP